MRILKIVVIVWAVEVGGHNTQKSGAVLAIVCPAKARCRYFCNSIGLVGDLEGARQEVFLSQRLRGMFRVNAGTAQKQQRLDAVAPGGLDHIILYIQVVQQEINRVTAVGVNASTLQRQGRRSRGFPFRTFFHVRLVIQIQLTVSTDYKVAVTFHPKLPTDGGPRLNQYGLRYRFRGDVPCFIFTD